MPTTFSQLSKLIAAFVIFAAFASMTVFAGEDSKSTSTPMVAAWPYLGPFYPSPGVAPDTTPKTELLPDGSAERRDPLPVDEDPFDLFCDLLEEEIGVQLQIWF